MSLYGAIAIVTGGSRGIGKGIAMQLAKAGYVVYITGRTQVSSKDAPGTLEDAAVEIRAAATGGGTCHAVICDHSDDASVAALFDRVDREPGRLAVLVNNAYGAVNHILETAGKKFWEKHPSAWDASNNVGLRSHYVASVLAARQMVHRKRGLIVNISSVGGLTYAGFATDVAYGVGKAALDRMSADVAHELREHGVACVSLWPGAVKTELIQAKVMGAAADGSAFADGESTEFAGAAVVALARNHDAAMRKTGKVLLTTELAEEFGFTDLSGEVPRSHPPGLRAALQQPPSHWRASASAKL